MVTVMRIKPRLEHDPACLLNVGDHPFLRQRSYASYRHMRDFDQVRLEEELEWRRIEQSVSLTANVFGRVCDGVSATRFASSKMKRVFEQYR